MGALTRRPRGGFARASRAAEPLPGRFAPASRGASATTFTQISETRVVGAIQARLRPHDLAQAPLHPARLDPVPARIAFTVFSSVSHCPPAASPPAPYHDLPIGRQGDFDASTSTPAALS